MRSPHETWSGPSPESSAEKARQDFLAACDRGDGPPPDLERILIAFDEPERSQLRVELEKILHKHSGSRESVSLATHSGRTDETINYAPPHNDEPHAPATSSAPQPDETVDQLALSNQTVNRVEEAERTHEFVSPSARDSERSTESDRTGEFLGALDGTIDHTAESDGNAAFSVNPDATVDHSTQPYATGEYVSSEVRSGTSDTQPMKKAKVTLPSTVAGYEIISVLGRGAMGVVYKARQRGLKRLVALKMILSGEHAGEQELARFQAEANAVAQLQHPGIVQIYEVGEDEGRPFFSLEFVDGVSLHKKLQGNPLPPKEAAALLKQMAEAMAYAHQRGVVHRDLKPANVLLTEGGIPKIGDFGLAKRLEDDESGLTRTGTVLGTPSYMPPEQAAGFNDQVGPLSDVYSLGAILYDMLTGRPPFRGTSVMDTIQQLRTREPLPPAQLQPSIPRDLETICLKCLEKDRFKRYPDAGALAADVGRFLIGEPILARPISNVERAWRWCRRNPSLSIPMAVGVLFVLLYIGSVTALAFKLDEKKSALDKTNQDLSDTVKELNDSNSKLNDTVVELKTTNVKLAEETAKATDNWNKSEAVAAGQRRVAQLGLELNSRMMQKVNNILKSRRLFASAPDESKKLRAQVLADMRETLQEYASQMTDKAVSVFTEALVCQVMGDLLMKMGEIKEPRELFLKGRNSVAAIATANPNHDRSRANLAVMETKLGDLALDMEGNAPLGEEQFRKSLAISMEILQHPRDNSVPPIERKRNVAHDDVHLGRALIAQGRSAESQKYFDEAFTYYSEWNDEEMRGKKLGEARSYMLQTTMLMGAAAGHRGDFPAGEKYFQKAFDLVRNLQANFPASFNYKPDYAEVEGAYGDLLFQQGKYADAETHYAKSLKYMREWYVKFPDDTAQQTLLALTLERMGHVAQSQKKTNDAKPYFQEAKLLREELWNVERGNYARQANLVLALARIGDFVNAANCNVIRPRMLKSTEPMLQLARCHAVIARDGGPDRTRNIAQALSALIIATDNGYKDAALLETDPDLSVLYNENTFKELMAGIKKR